MCIHVLILHSELYISQGISIFNNHKNMFLYETPMQKIAYSVQKNHKLRKMHPCEGFIEFYFSTYNTDMCIILVYNEFSVDYFLNILLKVLKLKHS